MEKGIKRRLNQQDIEKMVGRAFGGSKKLVRVRELKDGWFNTAYVLVLEDASKVVLKVAPKPEAGIMRYEHNIMRAEVEVLRLLKKRGDVPVPEVYFYANISDEPEYFIMEYLLGAPYNKVKEQLSSIEREQVELELGRLSCRMHEIKGERFGYYALF